MAAFELTGVSKRYGSRLALSDVNLCVEPGQVVGLLGPNGAGKTTVLRLLLGFCRQTSGRVQLRGMDPSRSEAEELRSLAHNNLVEHG